MNRLMLLAALPIALCLVAPTGEDGPPAPSADFVADYEEFAVAADQPLASAAGAEILALGGNAADAAAATMLALGVVNPASSGMGGGGFLLYYRASDQSLTFLDVRERAPAGATPDMYHDVPPPMEGPANQASQVGGLSSGVLGEPAGVAEMVRRFGALPLRRVVEPAVRLAEGGFPVSEATAEMSGAFSSQMKRDPIMRRWFEGESNALAIGQVLRQPELARTLRAFGALGERAIYSGRVAREIVEANRRAGGLMTLQDLADYRVAERVPLVAEHFGLRWVTAPPPSAGGFTLLQSLAVLEGLPSRWRPVQPGSAPSAEFLHALAESWKGPFIDRERYFGDPDHVELPLERLMEVERQALRVAAFHPLLAMPPDDYELALYDQAPAIQPDNAGTSHLCVVDREGNVASVTTTVNLPFGARYTAAGIVMNDEMDDFARAVGVSNAFGLIGGAPNLPGPGKRPVSTMTPTIVFDAEGPALCVGAAGGSRIVTATEQVALHALVFQLPLRDAMARARIHHQGRPNKLRSETFAPLDAEILRGLVARGHAHETMHNIATATAIQLLRGQGPRLRAASDPRKGGHPAGR